jgi:hypothetical protein
MRALLFTCALALTFSSSAYADCLEQDRGPVQNDIDWTISKDAGAMACMRTAMTRNENRKTGIDALKECNSGMDTRKLDACAAWACNYLNSKTWSPGC